jgi:tripartite-type tricarboxylate transporter receptor subunit TctC
MNRGSFSRACGLLGVMAAAACVDAPPASARDFFVEKSIDFVIGANFGGGYDIYARTIARHLQRHLAGHPTIEPRNMPGGGSGRAAAFLYSVAQKDGTVIGALFPGIIMAPLLDDRAQQLFHPTKFQYLGSADSGPRVCVTWHTSRIKVFEDALRQKTVLGASAVGGATRDYANMHKKTTGAKFDVRAGYKGSGDIFAAMERSEIDGMCGLEWSSLKAQKSDWLRDKKLNILVHTGLTLAPELQKLGVPDVRMFIRTEADARAADLIVSQQAFGRPYLVPPGVPPARVQMLRDALMATLHDAAFRAEARESRIEIEPLAGDKVQMMVEKLYAMPQKAVARARELIRSK